MSTKNMCSRCMLLNYSSVGSSQKAEFNLMFKFCEHKNYCFIVNLSWKPSFVCNAALHHDLLQNVLLSFCCYYLVLIVCDKLSWLPIIFEHPYLHIVSFLTSFFCFCIILCFHLPWSLTDVLANCTSSSRMHAMNHNWSATKQHLHLQSAAEISRHLVLSGDRIRQCGTSSGSHHKDTDQCL